MTNETLRMQFLSGVITESEYKVKLQENAAPIFDVVTMDEKTMVGTYQEGVGFKANKKGIEMGFKDNPKSIPNKTKKVKEKVEPKEKAKAKVNVGESLNESMIGGIVGIGAINQIPSRAKADYETAFEHFLGEKYGLNEVEIEEVKIEEGAFNDLLNKMESNTRMAADILTVITLAKEDKEGNAEKAVELLMKNHDLSEEAALEAVTRIFKKAFEWVDSMEEGKEVEEPTNY